MWAIQYHRYGDPLVLRREEIPAPALRDREVLVETVSSGVSLIDLIYRTGRVRLHGAGFPKQPGFDALGRVIQSRNPAVLPGSWVWTVLGLEPMHRRGTAAQLLALDPGRFGAFPAGYTPDPAVGSLPLGALTALKSLRDGARLQSGERVLVVGAAGAVGTAAIQLAKIFGAPVDAVCGARGLGVCSQLGAERTFDYRDSSVRAVQRGRAYDLVLVAAGRGRDWLGAVRPGGRTVFTRLDAWAATLPTALRMRARVRGVAAGHDAADLTWLAGLVAAGALRPVVGRTYSVDDLARAHAEYGQAGTCGARLVDHRPPPLGHPRREAVEDAVTDR